MLLQKISSAFKPGQKKEKDGFGYDENSEEKEMTSAAKWILSTKDGVKRVAEAVKKSEADVKKILTDPEFSRKAYVGEYGYSEISYAIGELKDRDDALKDYEEDSIDKETNELTKWALSNPKIVKEIADLTKRSESDIKKILKDPKFSRKADIGEPGFNEVWQAIAELKCKEEDMDEIKEERRKEQQKRDANTVTQPQQLPQPKVEQKSNNRMYKTTIIKVGGTNKQFIYRKK